MSNKRLTSGTLWCDAQRREQCNFSNNSGQIAQTQSNHLKTLDKPQTERQFEKKQNKNLITIFQKSEGHQRHTETDKLSQNEGDQADVTTK